jgi:hypothetical protein
MNIDDQKKLLGQVKQQIAAEQNGINSAQARISRLLEEQYRIEGRIQALEDCDCARQQQDDAPVDP